MLKTLQVMFGWGPKANARFIIRGNVYEGGFVHYAQKSALQYQLSGWMRSETQPLNQHIEMEVQGARPRIEKLLEVLSKGTPLSKISKIEVEWREPKPHMPAFRVRN